MTLRVALIGCGNLGSALAKGLARHPEVELVVCDHSLDKVAAAIGGSTAKGEPDADKAVAFAAAVLIAVKPGAVAPLLRQIKGNLADEALLVSCAAGLPLAFLEAAAGSRPIARAMPNTGAAHEASTTAIALNQYCNYVRDRERLETIFGVIGETREVRVEAHMHHATALAGSGPAFFLLALEAMTDAGLAAGLTREEADLFARGALRAASKVADNEHEHPAVLRARITSPGGTTIAGLGALEKGGARGAYWDAVWTALLRSKELAGDLKH
jgi:pyrroline-5-carboxylate reductase